MYVYSVVGYCIPAAAASLQPWFDREQEEEEEEEEVAMQVGGGCYGELDSHAYTPPPSGPWDALNGIDVKTISQHLFFGSMINITQRYSN